MKIAAYDADGATMIGEVIADGSLRPIAEITTFWKSLDTSVTCGEALASTSLKYRPAVPPTARVICIGLNYRLHALESGLPIPEVPVVFGRWANTLSVDGDPAPAIDEKFDWEGELGVVVGRRIFRVTPAQAERCIFGYVAFNDLSARTLQTQTPQWTMGKNSDASGPMSSIVTADEVGDPAAGLRLVTRVNDEVMQDSSTSDLIFTVPQIIAHLSQAMTLEPGDLIITGTPSGVGIATGRFLEPGDIVEVEIERIGRVRTPIVAAPLPLS